MEPRADQQTRTYRTGGGGSVQARRAGAGAFVTLCFGVGLWAGSTNLAGSSPFSNTPAWGFWVAGVIMCAALGIGVFAAACGLRERKSRAVASPEGLRVCDWLGREIFVEWDNIHAVVWQHRLGRVLADGYTLIIHVEEDGSVMPRAVGYSHYVAGEDLGDLREEIITRRGLSPAHATPPGPWEKLAEMVYPTETRVWK